MSCRCQTLLRPDTGEAGTSSTEIDRRKQEGVGRYWPRVRTTLLSRLGMGVVPPPLTPFTLSLYILRSMHRNRPHPPPLHRRIRNFLSVSRVSAFAYTCPGTASRTTLVCEPLFGLASSEVLPDRTDLVPQTNVVQRDSSLRLSPELSFGDEPGGPS